MRIPPPKVSFAERLIGILRHPRLVKLVQTHCFDCVTHKGLAESVSRMTRAQLEERLRYELKRGLAEKNIKITDDLLKVVATELNKTIIIVESMPSDAAPLATA